MKEKYKAYFRCMWQGGESLISFKTPKNQDLAFGPGILDRISARRTMLDKVVSIEKPVYPRHPITMVLMSMPDSVIEEVVDITA
jgi:hypothetical protein